MHEGLCAFAGTEALVGIIAEVPTGRSCLCNIGACGAAMPVTSVPHCVLLSHLDVCCGTPLVEQGSEPGALCRGVAAGETWGPH